MFASVIDEQKQEIETLVDRILAAKQSDPTSGTLTPEDIAIVESGNVVQDQL